MKAQEKKNVMTIAALELALDETTNALRKIRDRSFAEYGHNMEWMREDDWATANKALEVRDRYMLSMEARLKELQDDEL